MREHLAGSPRRYAEFLRLISDFQAARCPSDALVARASRLFEGHHQLLQGFLGLLHPHQHDILQPEPVASFLLDCQRRREASKQAPHPELLSLASCFVAKVKHAFRASPGGYHVFLQLLLDYSSGREDVSSLTAKVRTVFEGRDDLLREFEQIILTDPTSSQHSGALLPVMELV